MSASPPPGHSLGARSISEDCHSLGSALIKAEVRCFHSKRVSTRKGNEHFSTLLFYAFCGCCLCALLGARGESEWTTLCRVIYYAAHGVVS